ncbi:hypothetical protein Micbo1qcDRAFT_171578 [Microdochium bolleyi]|uniref:Uncharacterized protein n=1 Tax=Microdochium bolleyi TaxID=196109 RepID=A0A136JDD1_9PEZI|nr:hypothetical protein Micbo1qcDRAFT_171578 [Microdochium bolleyi]
MHPPTSSEKTDIVREILGSELPASSFQCYFQHYFNVICLPPTGAAVIDVGNPALCTHTDVLEAVRKLRASPELTRGAFEGSVFSASSILPQEREHAAHAVANAAFMVDAAFNGRHAYSNGRSDPTNLRWEQNQTFSQFLQRFIQRHMDQSQSHGAQGLRQQKSIKAWKLCKRHRIEIIGTDNILEHLDLDTTTASPKLKVFHQVAFLRAHLTYSQESPLELSSTDSLKLGVLPPRLALETLVSLHRVLFPIITGDKRSQTLLKKLIKEQGFDPDTRWVEFVRELPHDFTFTIWGDRIRQLHTLVKEKPPGNPVEAWFERHASDRNILIAAVIGLLFAGVFGLLSFLVGVAQLVLSWSAI